MAYIYIGPSLKSLRPENGYHMREA